VEQAPIHPGHGFARPTVLSQNGKSDNCRPKMRIQAKDTIYIGVKKPIRSIVHYQNTSIPQQ
jgi:hypothetical protein